MKALKKLFSIALCCALVMSMFNVCSAAENNTLNIGDYVIVGKYNGSPVVWRYAVNDDNGMLMVSDKILDYKRFSTPQKDLDFYDVNWYENSAYWAVSNVRAWLNSTADAGSIEWLADNPPLLFGGNGYADETGFLNNNNFSDKERQLFREVTQWTMLNASDVDLSENGLKEPFRLTYTEMGSGTGRDGTEVISIPYDISEIPNIYYGAAMQTTDKMFLLDELQLYRMWKNFNEANADNVNNITVGNVSEDNYGYKLRDGYGYWRNNAQLGVQSSRYVGGIRPAFYLNTDAIETMTGSGTLNDPYILNAGSNGNITTPSETDSITVTVDNTPLTFDVEPIIENDRVLVPMRKIFETLGANVEWNDDTQTVTATKDAIKINLQIGNTEMQVNDKVVTLDVAPKLLNDRTLVPIRAVSESLNANVDWNESSQRVIITTVK